ncbi:MAG: hypothetical protein K1X88_12960 [Nannocystaceae bacterium]|nr:hypothetical protein [Nannocystaceae bacterium]
MMMHWVGHGGGRRWLLAVALAGACGGDDAGMVSSGSEGTGSTGTTGTSETDSTSGPGSSSSSSSSTSTSESSTVADSSSSSEGTGATSSTDGSGSSSGGSSSGGSTSGGGMLADISGDHLLAVAAQIDPNHPLQYLATVVQTPDGDGALLDLSLQQLTLDVGSTTSPREPIGAPIVIDDVPVAADGSFSFAIAGLDIPGEANPITGSDLTLSNLEFDGQIVDADNWCGDLTGMVIAPLMLDLSGSTFAGSRVDGDLPLAFPSSC